MNQRLVSGLLVAALAAVALPAQAQLPTDRLVFHPDLGTDLRPTLERPMALRVRGELQAPEPVWTKQALWATRPTDLWGLAKTEEHAAPVWDPTTKTWFAWALGSLVMVQPDGSLPVVLQDLPGHDFDIRAANELVVYVDLRSEQIVLQRLDGSGQKRVLFSGSRFFNPRFSPDGSRVVVSESRSGGGHVWIVSTTGGAPRDLGRGNQPAWHPDGKRVLMTRFENDGMRHTSSSLFMLDLATGTQKQIAVTHEHIVLRPCFSPDGTWVAFAEERSGEVMLAPMPKTEGR